MLLGIGGWELVEWYVRAHKQIDEIELTSSGNKPDFIHESFGLSGAIANVVVIIVVVAAVAVVVIVVIVAAATVGAVVVVVTVIAIIVVAVAATATATAAVVARTAVVIVVGVPVARRTLSWNSESRTCKHSTVGKVSPGGCESVKPLVYFEDLREGLVAA